MSHQDRAGRPGNPWPMVTAEADTIRGGPSAAVESPLTEIFPAFKVERAYFSEIVVPAGLTIPAGQCGWFNLRRIRVDQDTGEEMTVFGHELDMLPCDTNGSGISLLTNAAIAWGDSRGMTAAIVAGTDLPVGDTGTWTAAPCAMPGIVSGDAAASKPAVSRLWTDGVSPYTIAQKFPAGTWSDTVPSSPKFVVSRVPYNQRVSIGSKFDIAFVVRGAYITGQVAAKTIVGHAHLALWTGRIRQPRDLTK